MTKRLFLHAQVKPATNKQAANAGEGTSSVSLAGRQVNPPNKLVHSVLSLVIYRRFDSIVFFLAACGDSKRSKMETLRLLRDYFPTAVFTGKCLVFISEDWRVELTEHKDSDFSKTESEPALIRVKIFKKALNGEFVRGHYEDFQLASLNELAEQIEKYVQSAIGTNLREQ